MSESDVVIMSGHSHWHNIREKKGKEDARRSKIFSKLSKAISVAARDGDDPEENFKLRQAIEQAKEADMPSDTIERAVQRGSGELEGVELKEVVLEAYGPGGSALVIEGITDNRNRTVAEVRKVLEEGHGKLAEPGAVRYLFDRKGLTVARIGSDASKDEAELAAIEAGADDIISEGDILEVYSSVKDIAAVKSSLEKAGAKVESAQPGWKARAALSLSEEDVGRADKLFSALDDHDDVQEVYTNIEF